MFAFGTYLYLTGIAGSVPPLTPLPPDQVPEPGLVRLVVRAGAAILEVYGSDDFGVEAKADESPVTRADLAANQVLLAGLAEMTPDVPVLSEESTQAAYDERRDWRVYWCVDPLDGTKEFVKRGGEFTVNVALMMQGRPVVGVVHAPVLATTWYGHVGKGAVRIDRDETAPIQVAPAGADRPLRVVASKSHMNDETRAYLAKLPPHELAQFGSSLKICRVADGTVDLYPRFGPTMEWDTAAAHAVVEAAGGSLVQPDGSPVVYNKEDLLNPWFVVVGGVGEDVWRL